MNERLSIGTVEIKADGPTGINIIRDLSESEYTTFKQSDDALNEFKIHQKLTKVMNKNYEETLNFIKPALGNMAYKFHRIDGLTSDEAETLIAEANRVLLNYLGSFNMVLDHLKTFLKRKFGENSPEYKQYKSLTAYFFDHNFPYRFVYHLRHYALHCGFPIDDLRFDSKVNHHNQSMHIGYEFGFNSKRLLKNFDWHWKIKEDLTQTALDEFDVNEIVKRAHITVLEVGKQMEFKKSKHLINAANFLKELTAPYKTDTIEVCLFYDTPQNDSDKLILDIKHIPMDIVDYILS